MTPGERDAYLCQPRNAILATVGADGRIHAVPVWFQYEGGEFAIITVRGTDSAKTPGREVEQEIGTLVPAPHRVREQRGDQEADGMARRAPRRAGFCHRRARQVHPGELTPGGFPRATPCSLAGWSAARRVHACRP